MVVLYSCNNRKDYFENTGHILSLSKTGSTQLMTSLEDSVKGTSTYTCKYSISTNENLKLNFKFKKGNAVVSSVANTVNVTPSDTGLTIIDFWVTDKIGAVSNAELKLTRFKNLKPVAVLSYYRIPSASPVDVFVAHDSYDRDKRFGGTITSYIYSIQPLNYNPVLSKDTMFYYISVPGTYTASLQVKDNDGELSDIVYKQIIIP